MNEPSARGASTQSGLGALCGRSGAREESYDETTGPVSQSRHDRRARRRRSPTARCAKKGATTASRLGPTPKFEQTVRTRVRGWQGKRQGLAEVNFGNDREAAGPQASAVGNRGRDPGEEVGDEPHEPVLAGTSERQYAAKESGVHLLQTSTSVSPKRGTFQSIAFRRGRTRYRSASHEGIARGEKATR